MKLSDIAASVLSTIIVVTFALGLVLASDSQARADDETLPKVCFGCNASNCAFPNCGGDCPRGFLCSGDCACGITGSGCDCS